MSWLAELGHGGGVVPVAALDGGAHLLQQAGQGAHGDAADAAEVERTALVDGLFDLLISQVLISPICPQAAGR